MPTDAICGHERDTLQLVLHMWSVPGLRVGTVLTAAQQLAHDDVNDPAKLAEMLAERGRELGWHVLRQFEDIRYPCCDVMVTEGRILLRTWTIVSSLCAHRRFLTIQQARTLLAAWLDLPDGDRVGAEKALRDSNG